MLVVNFKQGGGTFTMDVNQGSELVHLHSPMFPDEICSELQQKQPKSQ